MILFKKTDELRSQLAACREAGRKICFVPTMGALHKGHISLLDRAQQLEGTTVCSIFVNPTQFNDPSDFQKYPICLENDIYLLEKKGLHILLLPGVEEIYPGGSSHLEQYELGYLESVLEGRSRPGHFQGVCQVMNRLLSIVEPDHLLMGQKDYQQCMVVKRLLSLMHPSIVFHRCPTLREMDGLAMSSRNMRLNSQQRANAGAIYQALVYLQDHIRPGDLSPAIDQAKKNLEKKEFVVDYIQIADADSLELISDWDGIRKIVALVAAFQQDVRLIDNLVLNP
jgi:pantoate--beta-alanine ligase